VFTRTYRLLTVKRAELGYDGPEGGTDIIVVNARYESQKGSAWLDFTSAVAINLERAKKDEAIRDVQTALFFMPSLASVLGRAATCAPWSRG
jgi:hypothetical protein